MIRANGIFFWVPNAITALNLVCGCLAVIYATDGQLGTAAAFILGDECQ